MNAAEARIIYGLRVRKARLQKGLSQTSLAVKLYLGPHSKGTISNIERGKRWPSKTLAANIEAVLGIRAPLVRAYGTSYLPQEREAIST